MQLWHLVDYLGICGDKDNTRRCWAWHHKQQDNDDHHDDHDHGKHDAHADHDDHGDHEEIGGYMKKLEVVHKEVGGCLISYNLQLACVRKLEVI